MDERGESTQDNTIAPIPRGAGRRIGPFELLEVIGEGGMGTVWRARQLVPVRRDVALKLLRAGFDSPGAIARFESERQALALMDHECIAKIYEAGTTPDGFPYFAMEYVRGFPINAHCDRNRLTVDERLGLFARVCAGVHHAHQKAVIHRDLTPSNILVAGEGAAALPKIIDFGVAKAIGGRLTDHTMVTRLGTMIGTPEYMSPEQVDPSGTEFDTRADVYALGVILYELLTGTLPFESARLRSGGYDGLRRILREEEPVSPSLRLERMPRKELDIVAARRRTTPEALVQLVKDDLDWIVLKAMDKQPSRRYESASQLAEDLRRRRDNQPVLARPPTAMYRVSKLLRRHRAAAAVVASIALLVVAFGAIMALQAARIAEERDRARAQARRAEVVTEYLLGLFDSSDPSSENFDETETEIARRILLRGLDRADELIGESEAQADLFGGIGMVLLNRGLTEDAHVVLEKAHGARPDAADERAAQNLVALGRAKTELGLREEAGQLLESAVALEDSLHPVLHSDRATARRWLAELRRAEGRLDEAESLLREASDIQKKTSGPGHIDFASTITSLAHVLRSKGRLEESLALVEEAGRIQEKVLGERHGDIASNKSNRAGLLRELGRTAEAEPLYREALAMNLELHGEESAHTAIAYNNCGVFLRSAGRHDEARAQLAKAVAIGESAVGASSPTVAQFLRNWARACSEAGDAAEAERHLRRALAILAGLADGDDVAVAMTRGELGTSLAAQKKWDEAARELKESYRVLEAVNGKEDEGTRNVGERLKEVEEAIESRRE